MQREEAGIDCIGARLVQKAARAQETEIERHASRESEQHGGGDSDRRLVLISLLIAGLAALLTLAIAVVRIPVSLPVVPAPPMTPPVDNSHKMPGIVPVTYVNDQLLVAFYVQPDLAQIDAFALKYGLRLIPLGGTHRRAFEQFKIIDGRDAIQKRFTVVEDSLVCLVMLNLATEAPDAAVRAEAATPATCSAGP